MRIEALRRAVEGIVVAAGEPGYDLALETLLWNGRKPGRRPAAIVRAASAADVQAAVRFAARHGLPATPRGAGHHFSGLAQQAGIVIDLAGLDHLFIDPQARVAEVGPGVTNRAMVAALEPHGLAFPTGHCGSVPMSGFLLGGGVGWNGGELGVACFRVESVDVVTAEGQLLRASKDRHPDLFWAARGAGPLFFGIVVGFRLRLAKAAGALRSAVWAWPVDRHEDVAGWMQSAMAWAPASVEFSARFCAAPPPLAPAAPKLVMPLATVFAETAEAGDAILARIAAEAPSGALEAQVGFETTIPGMYDMIEQGFPKPRRLAWDSLWSDAAPAAVFAAFARGIERAPSPDSFAIALVRPACAAPIPVGEAAFSMIGSTYGVVYGQWTGGECDRANLDWLRGIAQTAAPAVKGVYVGQADIAAPGRLARAWSPEALSRLAALRRRWDPENRFRRDFGEPECEATAA